MSANLALEAPALPAFAVERGRHSVSGLSSGAFMTVQLHLAHSSAFAGAGIIAGGPYRCAESFRGSAVLAGDACVLNAIYIAMSPLTPAVAPKAGELAAGARAVAADGRIDPLDAMRDQRLYIFTGSADAVLAPVAVRATRDFYLALGVPEANIKFVDDVPAGHSIITSNPEDLPLAANRPPYLNYGGAAFGYRMQSHDVLNHIYPDLQPPATHLGGELLRFDQTPFVDEPTRASMNPYGYVYVPSGVLAGNKARAVHIVLHGCKQGCGYVSSTWGRPDVLSQPPYGTRYITSTGYNTMAESNDIIMLYPQAVGVDGAVQNPEGCWDWWGYTDAGAEQPDYYTHDAIQIRALKAMLDHLCGGGGTAPPRVAVEAEVLS